MKIFIFPGVYPSHISKGSGTFVYEQTRELARLGYEITVLDASSLGYRYWFDLSCRKIMVESDEVGKRFTKHTRGIMLSRLPRFTVKSYFKNAKKLYKKAVAENGKPDLIISHFSFPAGFVAANIAKRECIPSIVIEHQSLFFSTNLKKHLLKILNNTIETADSFVCVSNSLKEAVLKLTATKKEVLVIPNMIDDNFNFVPQKENESFKFFSAGNLVPIKQFELLIDAFCTAFSSDDNVTLEIAGKGVLFEKLTNMIKEQNREHQIKLLGWIPREQMKDRYADCNCFILLSEKETFGIVYREAMAVGRPIIATKNGGVEENWDDIQGILLEDNNPQTVAKAMKQMLDNYSDYKNEKISERSVALYSAAKITSDHKSLIEKVVNGG